MKNSLHSTPNVYHVVQERVIIRNQSGRNSVGTKIARNV